MKNRDKQNLKTFSWMISFAIIFFLGNSTAYLQDSTATGSNPTSNQVASDDMETYCNREYKEFVDNAMDDFRGWIERHFQNKSSSSSLLSDAISRYKELRKTLSKESYKYIPKNMGVIWLEGFEQSSCKKILNDALDDAKKLLESKSRSTSAVKKSTVLLDKYKSINDQLSTLSLNFVYMKSYLDTFATKLPCYISKYCNKG